VATTLRSTDVDAAVLVLLASDAALQARCPDGVYWGVAPVDAQRFVVVSLLAHDDTYVLGPATQWEAFLYLVKAVMPGANGVEASNAAVDIHRLLQDTQALAIPGYVVLLSERLEYVRDVEVDDVTDERWQHRGGHYRIVVAPAPAGTP
jgi:hypothetical protein